MGDASAVRLQVIQHACSSKCMGHIGNVGGCCKLGQRDWIIGPVDDPEMFLERLRKHFGRSVTRKEVLIDFEEGSRMFPDRPTWQNRAHFPALRILPDDPHACQFHDDSKGCSVHAVRPTLCRSYECGWLKDALNTLF